MMRSSSTTSLSLLRLAERSFPDWLALGQSAWSILRLPFTLGGFEFSSVDFAPPLSNSDTFALVGEWYSADALLSSCPATTPCSHLTICVLTLNIVMLGRPAFLLIYICPFKCKLPLSYRPIFPETPLVSNAEKLRSFLF